MLLYLAIICLTQQILNIAVCYKIVSFWIKPTWIEQSVMYGIPPYTSENHSKYGAQPYVHQPYIPKPYIPQPYVPKPYVHQPYVPKQYPENYSKYGVQLYTPENYSKYGEHTPENHSKYIDDDWDSGEITWRDVINLTIQFNRTYPNYRHYRGF